MIIWFLVVLVLFGLIAGAIARLLVPGPDPIGLAGTIALGIVGSFIGGFIGWALFGKDLDEGAFQPAGWLGSILGAIVALLIYRAVTRRRPRRTY